MLNTENYEYPQYSNEDCEYAHLNLDTKDTLTEHDVPDGVVDELDSGLTRVDHEAVGELHRLGTSSTELSRDNDLATLGTGLHDETEDTIASTGQGNALGTTRTAMNGMLTDEQRDHQEACSGETRTGRWQRDHGTGRAT